MEKVIERKTKIQEAIEQETDKDKKIVLKRVSDLVKNTGEYYYGDVFNGAEELMKDKEFVKKCIRLNPWIYEYITPELQDDREILLALAGAPICYNAMELGDYGSYAISPLHFILNANDSFYSRKEKNPIVTNNRKINDEEIILEALKAELLSFDYCEAMEREKSPIIRYEGLSTLKYIKNGREIEFSECADLQSLSYAADELMNNNEFQRKVVEILHRWKNRLELKSKEEELSSAEAEARECDEKLKTIANKKEEQNIGEE